MEALRVRARALSRDVVWFSLQKFRRFSSSSSTARARARSSFSDDPEGGSSIYRHALKFKPPSTINWQNRYRKALEVLEYPDRPSRWPKYIQQLHNSVSFIGTIDRLRESDCQYGDSGTYTWLTVKTSPDSNRSFEILLNMWDEMAEISIRHLKPNDFIYVSGRLGSYTKVDINGKLETYYQVTVKELNFVAHYGKSRTCQKSELSEMRGIIQSPTCQKPEQSKTRDSVETADEKHRKRLYLWQLFFANPYEWRDCRKKREENPNHPDFKHKYTGEALWLRYDDPPWIKNQLQRNDSRLAEGGQREEHLRFGSGLSPLVFDD
ncbi:protein OSB1, mitochondrial-like isoform X1 [Cornus florida]|uniref:protein OSB1, mitochondrial-like isoform X1 n=1 Tax=Cornus florida TaxID=4283 RepID=UPI0028985436|nr:protein OSB1, mitochondrial-like isoform X1 [Cornus florida]